MSEEKRLAVREPTGLAFQEPPTLTDIAPRMVEVGTIRTGYRNDKGFPVKLDFYVICDKSTEPCPAHSKGQTRPIIRRDIMEAIADRHGVTQRTDIRAARNVKALLDLPMLRTLDIMLMFDSIPLNFYTYRGAYTATQCLCKGFGIGTTATRLDKGTGEFSDMACPGDDCPWTQDGRCKPHGVLQVILEDDPMLGGVYGYRTTSPRSIAGIKAGLLGSAQFTGGHVAGLPFQMRVVFPDAKYRDKNGTVRRTQIPVTTVGYAGNVRALLDDVKKAMEQRRQLKINTAEYERQLLVEMTKSPEEETSEVAAEISAEFYTENPEDPQGQPVADVPEDVDDIPPGYPADDFRAGGGVGPTPEEIDAHENQRRQSEDASAPSPSPDQGSGEYEKKRGAVLEWLKGKLDEVGGPGGLMTMLCREYRWEEADYIPPTKADLAQLRDYQQVVDRELDDIPF